MGFSAGGTDVTGVQGIEQGVLTSQSVATTFSQAGGENKSFTITVPAGHIYNLKGLSLQTNTFVGTQTFVYGIVVPNSTASNYLTSGTTGLTWVNSVNMYLNAGSTITLSITTTGWTSGQKACIFLYQDILIN